MMNNNFKTIISNLKYLSKDVLEITFKITNEEKMCFTPGQFIIVKIDSANSIMRAYSVLKYDYDKNEITIAVKKVEGGKGTSIIFNSFELGQEIEIMGAMGDKLIVDKSKKDLVLVATGIGITPIICILNDLVESNYDGNVEFLYGARTKDELFYINEITKASLSNLNINFKAVLSREVTEFSYKGYVTDILKDMDLNNKHIYMCSSRAVASSVKSVLEDKGFDLSSFSCESA